MTARALLAIALLALTWWFWRSASKNEDAFVAFFQCLFCGLSFVLGVVLLVTLTGCATVGPNLSARGLREARNVEARADSVRLADSVSGPQPGTRTSRAGATSPAPLTLTWTNPSHLPAYESPGQRRACFPGSGIGDTLIDLDSVRVVAWRRVSTWQQWPVGWYVPLDSTVVTLPARGMQGKPMSVSIMLAGPNVYTLAVQSQDWHGNRSCYSNRVTVEVK